MNNKKLLIIVILLIPLAVISFMTKETNFNLPEKSEPKDIAVRLKLTSTNKIIEMPLEEYIIGVVAAEMPALFHVEALKAQAIAARSFALNKINNDKDYDIVDSINDQAYITTEQMKEKWGVEFNNYYDKIKKSIEETKNLVMTNNDKIISAYYFAMSNGYTENSEMVFGEERDYLKSVESSWDNEQLRNYIFETKIPKDEFCQKLDISCQNLDIKITDISNTNRVNELEINGKKIKGTEFRKKLEIRSTDFTINISDNDIYIETRGYGHGVGMSQYGANGMAEEGKTYQEILEHYYQNIKIIDYKDV